MIPLLVAILLAFFYLFSAALHAASFGSKLCANDQNYYCYKVKKGQTWEKLFPDEEERMAVMKLNRTNLGIYRGSIIAIPKDKTFSLIDLAPLEKQIPPVGRKVIKVHMKKLAWGAYDEKGTLINWGPVSGGKGYCPDTGTRCVTPAGNYAVYRKLGKGCVSSKFPIGRGGAPMPYCMFFRGGFALHGSYEVPGYHASHGCVRLFVNDAKWLNQEFVGDARVPVEVKNI